VYESPEVSLVQVDVGLPSHERVWQHVVRLHRAVSVVLLDGPGSVLLLRRYRVVQGRWGWELPGGLVDAGEELHAAAARELEDQAGYRAGWLEQRVAFQPVPESVDGERVVFTGGDAERVGEPVDTEGIARVEWVPLESVPGLIAGDEVWDGASVVGLLSVLAGSELR
jgi:8-oxo-dGTP pyrophosphatase MutT (NUDIX family)